MELVKKSETEAEQLFEEVIDYFTRVEKKTINRVNRDLAEQKVLIQKVSEYLKAKNVEDTMKDQLLKMFEAYVFGYHILEPLINDQSISDIKILQFDNIRIKEKSSILYRILQKTGCWLTWIISSLVRSKAEKPCIF